MRFWILFCLCLSNCARPSALDPQWPNGDVGTWRLEVEHAIMTWQVAIGPDCKFPLEVKAPGSLQDSDLVMLLDDAQLAKFEKNTKYIGEFNSGDGSTIVRGTDPANKGRVLMHEMGHAIGLDHDPDTSSIMYYITAAGEAPGPTPSDVSHARAAIGCE